jgi:hypothetical protein
MMDNLDKLIKSLEQMIDARDDMYEEDKYSNYREVLKIREERYNPSKKEVRDLLEAVIKDTVRDMFKNRIRHNL